MTECLNDCMKKGGFPNTASETKAADRRYAVLQYYVFIVAYLQQVLGKKDLFGT